MNNYKILAITDRCQGLFTKFGIDYPVMRKILQVKLTMDRRRVPTVLSGMSKKKKDQQEDVTEVNYLGKTIWVYGIIGCLQILLLFFGHQPMLQMSLIFGMMMFMMTTTMISDFSSVLLDVRDRTILSTKAIHPRTISMAKTLHILNYLVFMTSLLMGPVWVVSFFRYGILFGLSFLLEIILMDCLILVLTALVYYVVLRVYDGEKLKDIINYVQIILSITLAVGYQLVARSFELFQLEFTWTPAWWNVLLPPIWFASPLALLEGSSGYYYVFMTVLAVGIPLAAAAAYIKLLPRFEQHLLKLTYEGDQRIGQRRTGAQLLGKLLCSTREERVFFQFALRMFERERTFKLKVYPSLGFSFVLPFIFLFSTLRHTGLSGLGTSPMYYVIYFSMLIIPQCFMLAAYSGNYKGAWIYNVAPIQDFAAIQRAISKAVLLRLFMPVFLIQAILFGILFGERIVPDLVIAALSAIIYARLCYKFLIKSLPFSLPFDQAQQGSTWSILPMTLLGVIFPAVHIGTILLPHGKNIYMLLLFIISIWVWRGRSSKVYTAKPRS